MADIFESRFLLASLHIEAILRGTTVARRRKTLKAIKDGVGLGDAYSATLERIEAQDEEKANLAMATLTWICHSERPLHVDELCCALAVEIGETDFDEENVPSIGTLLDCCQGLITVDAEASTARLIHYTVQEYLCNFPGPVFATGQSVRPGPGRGRTTFRRPVPSFPKLARQVRTKDQDGRHCVVPHSPPPSSAVFRCFPPSPAVPHHPRRPYVGTYRPIPEDVSHHGARRPS